MGVAVAATAGVDDTAAAADAVSVASLEMIFGGDGLVKP